VKASSARYKRKRFQCPTRVIEAANKPTIEEIENPRARDFEKVNKPIS